MARLPRPGLDAGSWGSILNDYLLQIHKTDGTLKDGSVTAAALAPSAVTASTVAASGGVDGQVLVKNSTSPTGLSWGAASSVVSGTTFLSVQATNGTWSMSKAQVDAAHAAGGVVYWVTEGTITSLPSAVNDGIIYGDVVNGVRPTYITPLPPGTTTVTIAATDYPAATDLPSTANDVVVLRNVTGVIWTVLGTDYPSSAMVGTSITVPMTTGANITVTAKAASGFVLSGTTSWTLTFTDVAASGGTATMLSSHNFTDDADATINPATWVSEQAYGGTVQAQIGGTATVAAGAVTLGTKSNLLTKYTGGKAVVEITMGATSPAVCYVWGACNTTGSTALGVQITNAWVKPYVTIAYTFTSKGAGFSLPAYSTLKIETDVATGTVTYYINDVLKESVATGLASFTPAKLGVVNDSSSSTSFQLRTIKMSSVN